MTSNQLRALAVAQPVCRGERDAESLSDADWALLLLAAGQSDIRAPARTLACQVIQLAARRDGYFLPMAACARAENASARFTSVQTLP